MFRSMYTATCGMLVSQAIVDTTANNLANVNTTGFKKDTDIIKEYPAKDIYRLNDPTPSFLSILFNKFPEYVGQISTGAVVDKVHTDFSKGAIKYTDRKSDFYIDGNGFFVLTNDKGEIFFTRDGHFKIDKNGFLVNNDGLKVMALRPPFLNTQGNLILNTSGKFVRNATSVIVTESQNFNASLDGVITGVANGQLRIMIAKLDPKKLVKLGNNLYKYTAKNEDISFDNDSRLIQGAVETSNVKAVNEMVNLINSYRHFEINQKVITSSDNMTDKVVNQFGRL